MSQLNGTKYYGATDGLWLNAHKVKFVKPASRL